MFDSILKWIGSFLGWLDKTTGSYVLALFIFALIIEVILLPFGIKQQKNSKRAAMLRPKEAAIRKKYAGRNDQATKQKMGQEIQELYTKEGYNPMSGCLPLLIQFPIIIALYNIVINPLKYVIGMSASHIESISGYMTGVLDYTGATSGRSTIAYVDFIKQVVSERGIEAFDGMADKEALAALTEAVGKGLPNFNMFGLNLAHTPAFTAKGADLWLLLIPVLTFVVYFFSMKISRKLNPPPMTQDANAGCSNNMMDLMMPLMSVWITFSVPAAIGVYWIFKSIITSIKQFIIAKVMPLPVFTEEDYKAAEKEILGKGSNNKKVQKSPNAGKVRSLHHIDDDDYDIPAPTPEQKPKTEAKKSNAIEGAKIKDDSRDVETTEEKTNETSEENENADENN